jgi:hypothetical protein
VAVGHRVGAAQAVDRSCRAGPGSHGWHSRARHPAAGSQTGSSLRLLVVEQAANLQLESSHADPHAAELVEELTVVAGVPFADRLQAPPVLPGRTGLERWAHPEVGEVRPAYETLELPDDQRLVVYLLVGSGGRRRCSPCGCAPASAALAPPPRLGPERVAWLADRARLRFRPAA